MKIQLKFLLFSLLLAAQSAYTQQIISRLNLDRRVPRPDFYEYCPADKGLVTFGPMQTSSSRYLGLVKYNADFQQAWKKTVLEQNGNKEVAFMTVIGNSIFVFVSENMPREKIVKMGYYRYDLAGNLLAENESLAVYPKNEAPQSELRYVHSPNKKKLLCYRMVKNGAAPQKIRYYLFDEDGAYSANGEVDLRYPDNRFQIRAVKVSNGGNIFVMGKRFVSLRPSATDTADFVVYKYFPGTENKAENDIRLSGKFISDLNFALDREENIYVAGFYSDTRNDRIAGTFYERINATGAVEQTGINEFSGSFMAKFSSVRRNGQPRELRDFYLKDLVLRSDGGILLMAEKFYTTTQQYRDINGFWTTQEIYHYDDVILTSLSPQGNIEWQTVEEKEQSGYIRERLSFFNAIADSKVFLFYLYYEGRGENVFYSTIDLDGKASPRKPMLTDFRSGDEFYPTYCVQINSREVLLLYFASRGRVMSVVKVGL